MILTKPTSTNDTWSYNGKTFPQYVCGYLLGIYYKIDLPNAIGGVAYKVNF